MVTINGAAASPFLYIIIIIAIAVKSFVISSSATSKLRGKNISNTHHIVVRAAEQRSSYAKSTCEMARFQSMQCWSCTGFHDIGQQPEPRAVFESILYSCVEPSPSRILWLPVSVLPVLWTQKQTGQSRLRSVCKNTCLHVEFWTKQSVHSFLFCHFWFTISQCRIHAPKTFLAHQQRKFASAVASSAGASNERQEDAGGIRVLHISWTIQWPTGTVIPDQSGAVNLHMSVG